MSERIIFYRHLLLLCQPDQVRQRRIHLKSLPDQYFPRHSPKQYPGGLSDARFDKVDILNRKLPGNLSDFVDSRSVCRPFF